MKVEIWSDVLCPFCYIGKRNFEKALSEFSEAEWIEVEWKSFQLDPQAAPKPGTNVYTYLAESKGKSLDWSIDMHRQVEQMAAQAGLEYNFDIAQPANSYLAHRFIQLAKQKGLGNEAEEALFNAYFTAGKNISDSDTLIEIGESIGIDAGTTHHLIHSDEGADGVSRDIYEARQIGVTGVPFFVFDNKYAISGAQQPDMFTQCLERSFTEWETLNQ